MKIVCISGKARHGKDTTANFLKPELEAKGYRVLVAHFGDLVKFICKTYFDWDGQKDEKGRHILQYVGTDIIRAQAPDYWVDFVADMLGFFKDKWDYVLIPDSRFPNEIEKFADRGFEAISLRVIRDNFESALTEEQKKHISETALDDYSFDIVVHNTTLEELHERVCKDIIPVLEGEAAS